MKTIGTILLNVVVTLLSLFVWNGLSNSPLPFWPFFWAAIAIPMGVAAVLGLSWAMVSDD